MIPTLPMVLAEVEGRVSYLRALTALPPDAGAEWVRCDELGPATVAAAIDDGARARGSSRQVAASLLSQSYAFKIGAVPLAAYALGLPWPSPAAASTAVVLAKGRASQVAVEATRLGDPGDAEALGNALLEEHLVAFSTLLRDTVRLGERLVAGNIAASTAAAFRAVEGAARDRGDHDERARVRERAATFFATQGAQRWLGGAGRFDVVDLTGAAVNGWFWTRTSCCLWYQVPGSATCDDCSLIPASDLEQRRRDQLTASLAKPS